MTDASPTARAARSAHDAVTALLTAIESRDLRLIGRCLSPQARWQNVPHPAADGRDAVVALLADILTWSDEVQWDIVAASYEPHCAWLERVDRFRLDGEWYDVRCNGVIEVDATGQVREVRDYVDLGEWHGRVRPVLERLARRAPVAVVARHLAAVHSGDVVSMAADYGVDAVLVRGEDVHRGWNAIADYFDGVPARLGTRTVSFDEVIELPSGNVETRWTITSGESDDRVAGVDTFVVDSGRIVHQTVQLLSDDF
jgi:limonene-1,2-epoxide hydrolase